MSDPQTGETQRCFVAEDGYRRCNFIFRKGVAIHTKSGKWFRFRAFFRLKKKNLVGNEVILSKQIA